MHNRLLWLIEALAQHELDGILISTPKNRRYLSGFTGSAGYLLVSKNQAELATDSRYTEQATEQAEDFQVVPNQSGWNWLVESLQKSGLHRLGFESEHLTVAAHQQLLESIKQEPTQHRLHRIERSPAQGSLRTQRQERRPRGLRRTCSRYNHSSSILANLWWWLSPRLASLRLTPCCGALVAQRRYMFPPPPVV